MEASFCESKEKTCEDYVPEFALFSTELETFRDVQVNSAVMISLQPDVEMKPADRTCMKQDQVCLGLDYENFTKIYKKDPNAARE